MQGFVYINNITLVLICKNVYHGTVPIIYPLMDAL